jgi:hypothetical protein
MNRFAFPLMVATVFGMVATVVWMVACGGPPAGTGGAGGAQNTTTTTTDTPAACSASVEVPCMRYHIPLDGNPSTDVALRNKYIAAFGNACYMSEVDTFDCFYQRWQDACADAVKIAEVYGAAPFDKGYTCQPVAGTEDYTLQVGPDVANVITINYQAAPRQTPLTDINGVPTEVNGPYRNLPDPADVGPGDPFNLNSGMVDADGGSINQQQWVIRVNQNANDGGVRSDLAGFMWTCKGEDGGDTTCVEPDFLPDPQDPSGTGPSSATYPNVHHVVPASDKRCCPWGTNSYKNAAVISKKLNGYFTNNNPPAAEVSWLNDAGAYTP